MPGFESIFRTFNLAEGILWISIGAGLLVSAWRRPRDRGLKLAACLLFAAFGLSDFVEIHTGGWYKPWWLLAWKGTNVVGLMLLWILLRRRARAGS